LLVFVGWCLVKVLKTKKPLELPGSKDQKNP
jgi:hypothetical protein